MKEKCLVRCDYHTLYLSKFIHFLFLLNIRVTEHLIPDVLACCLWSLSEIAVTTSVPSVLTEAGFSLLS